MLRAERFHKPFTGIKLTHELCGGGLAKEARPYSF